MYIGGRPPETNIDTMNEKYLRYLHKRLDTESRKLVMARTDYQRERPRERVKKLIKKILKAQYQQTR